MIMSGQSGKSGSDPTITLAEPPSGSATRRKVSIQLQAVDGPLAGTTFDLSRGGEFIIGRKECEISLEDSAVSRRHARLSVKAWDHIYLHDLKSKNGVFVNGVRQTRRKIVHNDLIRIGGTSLRLLILETSSGEVEPAGGASTH
ncbi:MAG: FHA domain-containing protein [Acidobacteria bacterium]|nr:FHA domain-containing protein [Acidobacteriota bacterium]